MQKVIWFFLGALSLALFLSISGVILLQTSARGFGAHAEPAAWEKLAARQARLMAFPSNVKNKQNPIPNSPAVITDARAHWADHCAICHGNDGSGKTEMGKNTYPPAPDMRKQGTQNMTDGELFYIIENGVRWSGMPAWNGGSEHDQEDSWKLVHFIRHLPELSETEIRDMEKLNPKTPEERREEQEEEQFLNQQQLSGQRDAKQHHH